MSIILLACVALTQGDPNVATGHAGTQAHTQTQTRNERLLVVEGNKVEPHEHPFLVALFRKDSDRPNDLTCGGSLIANRWVLTAAHCIEANKEPSYYNVHIMRHDLEDPLNEEHVCTKSIDVQAFLLHPQYNDYTIENDAALLYLAEEVDCPGATAITLDDGTWSDVSAYPIATGAGWGATDALGRVYPDEAHEVDIPRITNAQCAAKYAAKGWDIYDSNLCAADLVDGGEDTCSGDSGGPLFVTDVGGAGEVQIGITSWGGQKCGNKNSPGVYTRVSFFVDWIQKSMAALSPDQCGDDPSWYKKSTWGRGSTSKNCAWVGGNTGKRCKSKGPGGVSAYWGCPETCGVCPSSTASPTAAPATAQTTPAPSCADDPSWSTTKKGKERDCNWVKRNPSKRCKKTALVGCPKTCGRCDSATSP